MRKGAPRAVAATVLTPVIFLGLWVLFQWAVWLVAGLYDRLWPLLGNGAFDPRSPGLIHDLMIQAIPVAAAVVVALDLAKRIGAPSVGYLIGAAFIISLMGLSASYVTWAILSGEPDLTWKNALGDWTMVVVAAGAAFWARPNV